jgi:hypothetical protein
VELVEFGALYAECLIGVISSLWIAVKTKNSGMSFFRKQGIAFERQKCKNVVPFESVPIV